MQIVSVLKEWTKGYLKLEYRILPCVPSPIRTAFFGRITYFILQIPHKNSGQA